jgi:hypothetical protein
MGEDPEDFNQEKIDVTKFLQNIFWYFNYCS